MRGLRSEVSINKKKGETRERHEAESFQGFWLKSGWPDFSNSILIREKEEKCIHETGGKETGNNFIFSLMSENLKKD